MLNSNLQQPLRHSPSWHAIGNHPPTPKAKMKMHPDQIWEVAPYQMPPVNAQTLTSCHIDLVLFRTSTDENLDATKIAFSAQRFI